MNNIKFLPMELVSVVGSEKIDFSVLAKRNNPAGGAIGLIFFGAFWTAFISIFVVLIFGPLFKGEDVHFEANGVSTTANWENFEPMIFPTLLTGLFVLVGIGMLVWGFYSLFQKGGYFVGTASRLVRYRKGIINTFDWEQFSGNMEINHRKGNIELQLRTGRMVSRKNRSDEFVPDTVYISGATNILEIEKICRKRIKENDPTPVRMD
jgi:hypothetical protein